MLFPALATKMLCMSGNLVCLNIDLQCVVSQLANRGHCATKKEMAERHKNLGLKYLTHCLFSTAWSSVFCINHR